MIFDWLVMKSPDISNSDVSILVYWPGQSVKTWNFELSSAPQQELKFSLPELTIKGEAEEQGYN